jgi:methionine-rich copper-binding protein CopC
MRGSTTCAAVIAALALAGCAGNGEGLDAGGRPLAPDQPGGPLVATFESIQTNVFTPVCTGCHAGATAPQGLRLDAASSFDLLVGVASNEVPALQRVQPGDPGRSYLVQKLEGRAAVGGRMPLGGPYLDDATMAVIRQWISDGALRSSADTAAMRPFTLVNSSPANGEELTTIPAQFVLAFSRGLDATRIDTMHVHLGRLQDGDAAAMPDLAVDARSLAANPRVLVVSPRAALSPGRYVLRIDAVALADTSGVPLGGAGKDTLASGIRIVFATGEAR